MSVTYVREFQGMWPIRTTEGGDGVDLYTGQWELWNSKAEKPKFLQHTLNCALINRPYHLLFTLSILYITIQLLELKPVNAHTFIKITIILQHTSFYLFWALLAHRQGVHNSWSWCIVILMKLCALVGSNCHNWITKHVLENVKFVNIQQAKQVYQFKNIQERLYTTVCFLIKGQ